MLSVTFMAEQFPWSEHGIAFGRLDDSAQQALYEDALSKLAGGWMALDQAPWVFRRDEEVLRLQNSLHEVPLVLTSFSADLDRAGLQGVRTLHVESRPEGFWALQSYVGGRIKRSKHGRAKRAKNLAAALLRLHRFGCPEGDSLAEQRGVALFFGRHFGSGARYQTAASELAELIADLPLVSIHGDVGSAHNCHFHPDDSLAGLLDPGAVRVGPSLLDLACAASWELRHGFPIDPLLESWSPLDAESEARLWPLLRLVIERMLGGNCTARERDYLMQATRRLPR